MQNTLQISQRGLEMPESPIRKLAPLAYAAEEDGVKIYRLNIGQPDLPTPQKALDALKTRAEEVITTMTWWLSNAKACPTHPTNLNFPRKK